MDSVDRENTCTERKIIAFRVFNIVLIIAVFGSAIWHLIEIKEEQYVNKRYSKLFVIGACTVIISLITGSFVYLLCLLSKKEAIMGRKLGQENAVYKNEKTTLAAITLLYILSYWIDSIYYSIAFGEGKYIQGHCSFVDLRKDCSNLGPILLQ